MMDIEMYKFICYSLAKAYTTPVRLYENEMPVYYYSVYNIEPDPLGPYLHQIMDSGHEVGIITTSIFQFYAFLTLESGLRVIIGPTRALQDAGKKWMNCWPYCELNRKKEKVMSGYCAVRQ